MRVGRAGNIRHLLIADDEKVARSIVGEDRAEHDWKGIGVRGVINVCRQLQQPLHGGGIDIDTVGTDRDVGYAKRKCAAQHLVGDGSEKADRITEIRDGSGRRITNYRQPDT